MATSSRREIVDMRVHEDHDYFLPREFVDTFAHEVKARQELRKPDLPSEDRDTQDHNDEEDRSPDNGEGDPTDGGGATFSSCASHWKAASADDKKRMWAIYEECGIFASTCRHGMILWIADMVRSGEK